MCFMNLKNFINVINKKEVPFFKKVIKSMICNRSFRFNKSNNSITFENQAGGAPGFEFFIKTNKFIRWIKIIKSIKF